MLDEDQRRRSEQDYVMEGNRYRAGPVR